MHVCVLLYYTVLCMYLLYYTVLCMYVYVHVLKYAFIFLLRRRERLRSIVMSMSVCVSVCLSVCKDISGTKFLCMLPISVVRSSYGTLTIGRIAYRREGGNGSAQRGRRVIYDCLVIVVLC